ncbi:MAG: hypothetical protein AAGA60_05035 [Cyanobacteria bacterium P01_E01_bin.42]
MKARSPNSANSGDKGTRSPVQSLIYILDTGLRPPTSPTPIQLWIATGSTLFDAGVSPHRGGRIDCWERFPLTPELRELGDRIFTHP